MASVVSGGIGSFGGSPPCPGSTTDFGNQYHAGTCRIGADTTWANGTFVLRGDLVVSPGVRLALTNMTLLFDPTVEQEWRVDGDVALVLPGGGGGWESPHYSRDETRTPP